MSKRFRKGRTALSVEKVGKLIALNEALTKENREHGARAVGYMKERDELTRQLDAARNPPSVTGDDGRIIPISALSSGEVLRRLHQIETEAFNDHSRRYGVHGDLKWERLGLISPSYGPLVREAAQRGLIRRIYPDDVAYRSISSVAGEHGSNEKR